MPRAPALEAFAAEGVDQVELTIEHADFVVAPAVPDDAGQGGIALVSERVGGIVCLGLSM